MYIQEACVGHAQVPYGSTQLFLHSLFYACGALFSTLSWIQNLALSLVSGRAGWVTTTFTWLYIVSQELSECDYSFDFDILQSGSSRFASLNQQDYWLVYLLPLIYYYGDIKLGEDDHVERCCATRSRVVPSLCTIVPVCLNRMTRSRSMGTWHIWQWFGALESRLA